MLNPHAFLLFDLIASALNVSKWFQNNLQRVDL